MILSSRPADLPEVLIEEDLSVDPPMVMISIDGKSFALKRQDEGFTLFEVVSILHELGVDFHYQELR